MRRPVPLLTLLLVCSASGLQLLSKDERKDEPKAAAGKDKKPKRWLDKPATKSAMLILAGGLSGALAKSVVAPLERVKIMSQAGDNGNFLKLLADVVRAEGWTGLWRGNTANVIRVIPNKGVLMMCSDMYKAGVAAALPTINGASVSSIAGGLAGVTAVICTYPLELARTRMAYRIQDGSTQYNNLISTFRAVIASDGLLGLYSGVWATLLGVLPFEGIKFGLYDILKSALPRNSLDKLPPIWTLVAGALSGAIAHFLTYPLDTVRRRMQVSGAVGAAKYSNIFNCLQTIIKKEGWGALFFGLAPTMLRAIPGLGIHMFVYEIMKIALGLDN
jgi:hypothetical protein